jgi:RNA-directed DNA polymerase
VTAASGSMHAIEKVRVLQRKLYRAAKAQPKRTFGVLHEHVYSQEVLATAWQQVRRNRGNAGVDGETIVDIEARGVDDFLNELQEELRTGRYRPQPVRRVYIPKADGRQRPLGIPRVKDRVAQAAVRIVIEPLFEASFRSGSYGFRPKRSANDAIKAIRLGVHRGLEEVIDLDLKSYFDTIDHEMLMSLVRRRVRDPRVLWLIRRWLRIGVLLDGQREETFIGTPQGGVISPLLANIYLHPLDVFWEREMSASQMIRYADDAVVLCTKGQAEKSMTVLRQFLERMRLTVNEDKTRLTTAQEGFDFLGMHLRQKPSRRNPRRHICYAWPSRRSMQRIRDKVRAVVGIDGRPSLAEKIAQLNPILRGWGNYFRGFHASVHFRRVDEYTWFKVRRWLRRKHDGGGRFSSLAPTFIWKAGLHRLCGTVRYAR